MLIMGQTSTCCMACLMPQSQVSCSFQNTHIFTLDRPTYVHNRLSAFQVAQGFSVPAERCSSALMLRCALASGDLSRSLHNSMRAAFAVVLMGSVHLIKLFRDLRHHSELSIEWEPLFRSLPCPFRTTCHRSRGGAIPASTGRLLVFVGFRQPVIIRQVSLSVASSLFAWAERSHTGENTLQLSSTALEMTT